MVVFISFGLIFGEKVESLGRAVELTTGSVRTASTGVIVFSIVSVIVCEKLYTNKNGFFTELDVIGIVDTDACLIDFSCFSTSIDTMYVGSF